MGQSVYNFVQNFQDMFIIKVNTLTSFPNNLSNLELNLINQQLEDISSKLQELSTLTRLGSEENLKEYKQIIEVLNTKLEYIEDKFDFYLYSMILFSTQGFIDEALAVLTVLIRRKTHLDYFVDADDYRIQLEPALNIEMKKNKY